MKRIKWKRIIKYYYVEIPIPFWEFLYPWEELLVYSVYIILLPLSTMECQKLSKYHPIFNFIVVKTSSPRYIS